MELDKDYILYIDDEIENLDVFKIQFRKDYNIITTLFVHEAWELLEKYPFKIILSDQRMPEMDGVEFLAKAMEKYPDIPRILITAYGDFNTLLNSINIGHVFHYVSKPWNKNDLNIIFENAIEQYNLKYENKKLIEELKQINNELIISKNRAEESDKLKTAFLTNLSHEVRTPLNAIIGFSNLMLNEHVDEDTKETFVREINKGTEDILNNIEDIIQLSKLETQQFKPNMIQLSLNQLIRDVYTEFSNRKYNELQEIAFKMEVPECNAFITSDYYVLKNIIHELTRNAFRNTNKGFVTIGFRNEPNHVSIFVSDTGIGIPKNELPFIFNSFYKIKRNDDKTYRGTGVGLAIANLLKPHLGYQIEITSKVKKGTTFQLIFPIL